MQQNAQGIEMVMAAPRSLDQSEPGERWPAPIATLFIVTTSLALWSGIILTARLILG